MFAFIVRPGVNQVDAEGELVDQVVIGGLVLSAVLVQNFAQVNRLDDGQGAGLAGIGEGNRLRHDGIDSVRRLAAGHRGGECVRHGLGDCIRNTLGQILNFGASFVLEFYGRHAVFEGHITVGSVDRLVIQLDSEGEGRVMVHIQSAFHSLAEREAAFLLDVGESSRHGSVLRDGTLLLLRIIGEAVDLSFGYGVAQAYRQSGGTFLVRGRAFAVRQFELSHAVFEGHVAEGSVDGGIVQRHSEGELLGLISVRMGFDGLADSQMSGLPGVYEGSSCGRLLGNGSLGAFGIRQLKVAIRIRFFGQLVSSAHRQARDGHRGAARDGDMVDAVLGENHGPFVRVARNRIRLGQHLFAMLQDHVEIKGLGGISRHVADDGLADGYFPNLAGVREGRAHHSALGNRALCFLGFLAIYGNLRGEVCFVCLRNRVGRSGRDSGEGAALAGSQGDGRGIGAVFVLREGDAIAEGLRQINLGIRISQGHGEIEFLRLIRVHIADHSFGDGQAAFVTGIRNGGGIGFSQFSGFTAVGDSETVAIRLYHGVAYADRQAGRRDGFTALQNYSRYAIFEFETLLGFLRSLLPGFLRRLFSLDKLSGDRLVLQGYGEGEFTILVGSGGAGYVLADRQLSRVPLIRDGDGIGAGDQYRSAGGLLRVGAVHADGSGEQAQINGFAADFLRAYGHTLGQTGQGQRDASLQIHGSGAVREFNIAEGGIDRGVGKRQYHRIFICLALSGNRTDYSLVQRQIPGLTGVGNGNFGFCCRYSAAFVRISNVELVIGFSVQFIGTGVNLLDAVHRVNRQPGDGDGSGARMRILLVRRGGHGSRCLSVLVEGQIPKDAGQRDNLSFGIRLRQGDREGIGSLIHFGRHGAGNILRDYQIRSGVPGVGEGYDAGIFAVDGEVLCVGRFRSVHRESGGKIVVVIIGLDFGHCYSVRRGQAGDGDGFPVRQLDSGFTISELQGGLLALQDRGICLIPLGAQHNIECKLTGFVRFQRADNALADLNAAFVSGVREGRFGSIARRFIILYSIAADLKGVRRGDKSVDRGFNHFISDRGGQPCSGGGFAVLQGYGGDGRSAIFRGFEHHVPEFALDGLMDGHGEFKRDLLVCLGRTADCLGDNQGTGAALVGEGRGGAVLAGGTGQFNLPVSIHLRRAEQRILRLSDGIVRVLRQAGNRRFIPAGDGQGADTVLDVDAGRQIFRRFLPGHVIGAVDGLVRECYCEFKGLGELSRNRANHGLADRQLRIMFPGVGEGRGGSARRQGTGHGNLAFNHGFGSEVVIGFFGNGIDRSQRQSAQLQFRIALDLDGRLTVFIKGIVFGNRLLAGGHTAGIGLVQRRLSIRLQQGYGKLVFRVMIRLAVADDLLGDDQVSVLPGVGEHGFRSSGSNRSGDDIGFRIGFELAVLCFGYFIHQVGRQSVDSDLLTILKYKGRRALAEVKRTFFCSIRFGQRHLILAGYIGGLISLIAILIGIIQGYCEGEIPGMIRSNLAFYGLGNRQAAFFTGIGERKGNFGIRHQHLSVLVVRNGAVCNALILNICRVLFSEGTFGHGVNHSGRNVLCDPGLTGLKDKFRNTVFEFNLNIRVLVGKVTIDFPDLEYLIRVILLENHSEGERNILVRFGAALHHLGHGQGSGFPGILNRECISPSGSGGRFRCDGTALIVVAEIGILSNAVEHRGRLSRFSRDRRVHRQLTPGHGPFGSVLRIHSHRRIRDRNAVQRLCSIAVSVLCGQVNGLQEIIRLRTHGFINAVIPGFRQGDFRGLRLMDIGQDGFVRIIRIRRHSTILFRIVLGIRKVFRPAVGDSHPGIRLINRKIIDRGGPGSALNVSGHIIPGNGHVVVSVGLFCLPHGNRVFLAQFDVNGRRNNRLVSGLMGQSDIQRLRPIAVLVIAVVPDLDHGQVFGFHFVLIHKVSGRNLILGQIHVTFIQRDRYDQHAILAVYCNLEGIIGGIVCGIRILSSYLPQGICIDTHIVIGDRLERKRNDGSASRTVSVSLHFLGINPFRGCSFRHREGSIFRSQLQNIGLQFCRRRSFQGNLASQRHSHTINHRLVSEVTLNRLSTGKSHGANQNQRDQQRQQFFHHCHLALLPLRERIPSIPYLQ